ncbi:MAG: hypothetical protein EBW42_12125, partial [Rhodobacterales bacterium]|nr:hypothetical protein [Rhodobacterales bacterium]
FNTGGDSFLAEFSSAVSAVECAVEFQKAIEQRNSTEDVTVKLKFRIGINSGDVIKEKDNLLGDGVNIAARLEALAQSGGITISKSVYDYVKGKTQHEFNDLGLQKVKLNEFHAYDLLIDESQKRKIHSSGHRKPLFIGLLTCALIFLVGFFAYMQFSSDFQPLDQNKLAYEIPEGPSITVAKFNNLNPSEDTDYLSQSITDNIVSVLSGSPALMVMAPKANKQAKRCVEELLEKDPQNPVILHLAGWVAFQGAWMGWSPNPEEDKAKSRKIAESIIEEYPGPPYLLLGWIDLVNGDIDSVRMNAQLALEVAPKNNLVLPVAASLLRRVGSYEEAQPAFEKTIRLNPNPLHWVWIEYAGTLIALQEYDRAKGLLKTALNRQEAGTQNTIVYMYLAAISIFEEKIEEASKHCNLAKEVTASFDLEKNLKAVSTTTDTAFYNSLTEAIRKACT